MLVLTALLFASSVTDLRNRTIPNWLTLPGALAGIALAVGEGRFPEVLLTGLLAAFPFLAAALIRPEGMGMGDVKLAAVLGLFLGWQVWPALVVSLAIAGLTGVLMALGSRREPTAIGLPLAPFMAVGVGLTLACGASPLQ